jgi:hypothetical protein
MGRNYKLWGVSGKTNRSHVAEVLKTGVTPIENAGNGRSNRVHVGDDTKLPQSLAGAMITVSSFGRRL